MWDLLVAWVCMLLAWGILGYFTKLRDDVRDRSGTLDEQNEWTFWADALSGEVGARRV